mmetsp:Transcript_15156/g.19200  ORF Transcript_15156/g.19200 Transcript_15156/m.19200 type:complete len:101 (+) Transcript_15156:784-1086(+)
MIYQVSYQDSLQTEDGQRLKTNIAKALGTNRTAFQCFSRYQRSLNTAIVKGKWTPQEDERLKDAIQQYGDKNWQQVAHYLNGRTGQQCLHRWQKNIETEY